MRLEVPAVLGFGSCSCLPMFAFDHDVLHHRYVQYVHAATVTAHDLQTRVPTSDSEHGLRLLFSARHNTHT